jgi:hypothetical protein
MTELEYLVANVDHVFLLGGREGWDVYPYFQASHDWLDRLAGGEGFWSGAPYITRAQIIEDEASAITVPGKIQLTVKTVMNKIRKM